MCGIIGAKGIEIEKGLSSMQHRGKDAIIQTHKDGWNLGHNRLAILDLDERSNQPFTYGDTTIIYNGEIWNYEALRQMLGEIGFNFKTDGDTEIVSAMINHYDDCALEEMDGMFAIGWLKNNKMNIGRDRYGEIPLYYCTTPQCFASEKKALLSIGIPQDKIKLLDAGNWYKFGEKMEHTYYDILAINEQTKPDSAEEAILKIREKVRSSIEKRTISDVPVCTLLSGGLDSSIVTCLLKEYMPNLVAYTAVYNEKSRDYKCAKELADKLEIELRVVLLGEPSLSDVSEVINIIELNSKVQIEIGYACVKLAEAMNKDGFKVCYSGEGSDELWASYGFAYYGIQKYGWNTYRKLLYNKLSRSNFVRVNQAFMKHTVECRNPFADKSLVHYVLKLAIETFGYKPEAIGNTKNLLQSAFADVLPASIITRPKMAFQDGLKIKKSFEAYAKHYKQLYKYTFG